MKSCYIHIPFCNTICTYCDFCKMYYNKKWINKYLNELEKEIKSNYKDERLTTLYIGGGTPTCLNEEELEKLLKILTILKLDTEYEYTIESNVETLSLKKIKILKKYGVNRISIGVQSIVDKNIEFLGRKHNKELVRNKIEALKGNGINNINIDLMYALPVESIDDLKEDLDFFLSLDIPHISTYSLIIEPHTILYINNLENIDQETDFKMYEYICKTLKENGYKHYEISNFSKPSYESKHNLTYWNNLEYYGFGLGASGYTNNVRYDNTRNIHEYLNGKQVKENINVDINMKIENEFILGLRKLEGINKKDFYNKYNLDIENIEIINKLLKENKLIENGENIFINPKYIYTSNLILMDFLGGNYEQN